MWRIHIISPDINRADMLHAILVMILTVTVLVRDNLECCFGPGAALYDCVMVRMNPGKTTNFSIRPVTVEGDPTVHHE